MATTTTTAEYMLGDAADERARLMAQAALLEDEARALLDRVDIPVGGDVIDIGCGPIGILPLLSDRVGPHGQVTGFDRHGDMLDHAARTCARLGNVRFALGDATDTGFTPGTFDVAHIRLLLVNVSDPIAVVREAARIVRPGGAVVVQEVDWLSWQCEPGLPAWAALRDILRGLWHSRGLDPEIGRRLPTLLRAAGLCEVQATAHAGIDGAGHPYRRLILTFADRFRDRILAAGLATADELDALQAAVDRHLADPGTVVVRAMTVQAWGRVAGRVGMVRP
jgi:SAM-dependent methyltransferase